MVRRCTRTLKQLHVGFLRSTATLQTLYHDSIPCRSATATPRHDMINAELIAAAVLALILVTSEEVTTIDRFKTSTLAYIAKLVERGSSSFLF